MKTIFSLVLGAVALLSGLWFFVLEKKVNDHSSESRFSLVDTDRQLEPRREELYWTENGVDERTFEGVSADLQDTHSKSVRVSSAALLSRLRELEVGSVVSLYELFGLELDRYYMINYVEFEKYGVNVRGDILDGYKGMGINASFSEDFVFGQYATEDGNYLFESHGDKVVLSLVKHDKGDEVDVD